MFISFFLSKRFDDYNKVIASLKVKINIAIICCDRA